MLIVEMGRVSWRWVLRVLFRIVPETVSISISMDVSEGMGRAYWLTLLSHQGYAESSAESLRLLYLLSSSELVALPGRLSFQCQWPV